MSDWYILDGHKPVKEPDPINSAKWFGEHDCHVGDDMIGDVRVSTVFLGVDHVGWYGGPPELFETMVFGGPLDLEQERYATWDEAEAGHKAMMARVQVSK